MLGLIQTSLMEESLTAKAVEGRPQREVPSPLLWSLVVDEPLIRLSNLDTMQLGTLMS